MTTPLIITQNADGITVRSPYHPDWVAQARALGGRWDGSVWRFPTAAASLLRERLLAVYGEDGTPPPARYIVTVRWRQLSGRTLAALGRVLADRPARDDRVRLGDGVAIVEGGFPSSGGSMRHPTLAARTPLTLRVSGVPKHVIDHIEQFAAGGELLDVQPDGIPAADAAVPPAADAVLAGVIDRIHAVLAGLAHEAGEEAAAAERAANASAAAFQRGRAAALMEALRLIDEARA